MGTTTTPKTTTTTLLTLEYEYEYDYVYEEEVQDESKASTSKPDPHDYLDHEDFVVPGGLLDNAINNHKENADLQSTMQDDEKEEGVQYFPDNGDLELPKELQPVFQPDIDVQRDQSTDDLRRRIFLEGRQQPVKGDELINAIEDTNVMLGDQPVDPENLAYILIGVCVGLSILYLIVVAVTIGYKSETHYRLENTGGHRRRIRLIKASSSEGSTSSETGTDEDNEGNDGKGEVGLSTMKLGSWFTSKHPVQTLDRKKAKMVYPSAVYLDNLESSKNAETPVKVANRSEVVTDEENFEDDLNHKRTTSRAKITKKVALNDAQSVSSMDTIKSEDAVVEGQPRRSSESTVASETAALTTKPTKSKVRSYTKKIDANKAKATASGKNESVVHNPRASSASGSKHKYLSHRSATAASASSSVTHATSARGDKPHDNHSQISSS